MASKVLRAVVLGPPGSGKGTVCERIARSFGLQHLSSGQFLRESLRGGGGECRGSVRADGAGGGRGDLRVWSVPLSCGVPAKSGPSLDRGRWHRRVSFVISPPRLEFMG